MILHVRCDYSLILQPLMLIGFEFTEHGWVGDQMTLTWTDGKKYTGVDKPFVLPSLVQATCGQINGLAGDFYAITKPSSDGKDPNDQIKRFGEVWNSLSATSSRMPAES